MKTSILGSRPAKMTNEAGQQLTKKNEGEMVLKFLYKSDSTHIKQERSLKELIKYRPKQK